MLPDGQVPDHGQHREHEQRQAQRLGDADGLALEGPVEEVQAVGTQALDPEAADAVPQEVEAGILTVEAAVLGDGEHQDQQSDQIPHALVEEGGVDFDGLGGAGPQLHAPGQVGHAAEGLAVDEVGPAADALAQDQSDGAQVGEGGEFQLMAPGVEEQHDDAGNDGAVDGQAAVPQAHHGAPVQTAVRLAVEIQVEQDIVDAGADDAAGDGPQDQIHHVVLADAEVLGLAQGQSQARQHGAGQDDTVPVDAVADVDGDHIRVKGPVPEQAGETDGHIFECVQNTSSFLVMIPSERSR